MDDFNNMEQNQFEHEKNEQVEEKVEATVEEPIESTVPPIYDYEYSNEMAPESEPKPKKSHGWKKWVLCIGMAVVFGAIASVVYQTSNYFFSKYTETNKRSSKMIETTVAKGETTKKNSEGIGQMTDVSQVAKNVMPSVVSITNLSVQEVRNYFFGGTVTQQSKSSGSGIIIGQNDTELLIVSNNHVVEGNTSLTVTFVDGQSVEAVVKGTDSAIDVAILAVPLENIDEETLEQIKVATLGDSDSLAVGEPAIAIGNALGYGQSVTSGIISALDRELSGFDTGLIQTDAAINPGNSGGALLNQNGEVIGINTAKASGNNVEGIGYAIPISDISDIINELMNREVRDKVDKEKQGTIGITGVDVDASVSQYYNMPQGVFVKGLVKGGAAQKAGIVKGSIITKFEGTSISSMQELKAQLEYYEEGEKVKLEIQVPSSDGGYEKKTYEVKLSGQSVLED